MRLAIIIGHSSLYQGARSYNGFTEWSYYMDLCHKHLWHKLMLITDAYEIFWRDNLPYRKAIKEMVIEELIPFKPDLCIELHFNAFDGKTPVQRAEYLYTHDKALKFGVIWSVLMKENYLLDSVVGKPVEESQRGYFNLASLEQHGIPNVILEPCFADTKNQLSEAVIENMDKYACLLARCIRRYQGMDV